MSLLLLLLLLLLLVLLSSSSVVFLNISYIYVYLKYHVNLRLKMINFIVNWREVEAQEKKELYLVKCFLIFIEFM